MFLEEDLTMFAGVLSICSCVNFSHGQVLVSRKSSG